MAARATVRSCLAANANDADRKLNRLGTSLHADLNSSDRHGNDLPDTCKPGVVGWRLAHAAASGILTSDKGLQGDYVQNEVIIRMNNNGKIAHVYLTMKIPLATVEV